MGNQQTEGHKGDILIVDNDLSSLNTLSSMLTAEGYEVRGAPDGPMALTVIENQPPELVLLDIQMPGMDGFEVCRKIKAEETSSDIPVLFLSARVESQDKVKAFETGAVDYITKPFQAQEVLARVNTHIKLSRLSRNLNQQVEERTAQLKKSEEQLMMMKYTVHNATDGIAWIAPDGRYLYVNEAGCQSLKHSSEKLLSMSVSDIDPNYPQEKWNAHYRELKHKGSMRLQTQLKDKEGQKHYVDINSKHLQFGDNEFICSFARDITDLKVAEADLEERLAFEQLIAEIATKLTHLLPEHLDVVLDETIQLLARFLRTERAFLAQLAGDGSRLVFTNLWAAEGINVQSDIFNLNMVSEIPWVVQQIRSNRIIKAGPGLAGLPDEAEQLRKQLEIDGITSGVAVPIRSADQAIGMLGLDTVGHPRHYPQPIVDRLKILADMIGSTIQRVRAQKKLQQYQHIVESTSSIVGLVDKNYVYQYVNDSYCAAFGKDRQEIVGCSVADFFEQQFFEQTIKPHYDRCFAGERVSYQAWGEFPGWGHRYLDVRYSPFYGTDGKVSAVVVSAHDITGIKLLELKLTESEERFRTFMDNLPADVYIKDENDIHLYGNTSAFKTASMKPDEFIGSSTRDLFPTEIAERLIALDRKVRDGDSPKIVEEWSNTANSETFWRKDIKFPIQLESGKTLLGGIAIDITEIKQLEQELTEQLAFERLIADISSQLEQTGPVHVEKSIDFTLQALGRFFGIQRAFLAEFKNDGKNLYHRRFWAAEGIDVPSFLFDFDMAAASPWFAQQIRIGNVINTGPGLVDLPDESGDLREQLERDGINSGVVVPVRVEGRSIGMIGLDTVDQPFTFPPAIVERLKIVADMIGSTLKRVQTQEVLQSSLNEVEQLKYRLEQENIYLRGEIELRHQHDQIIGRSQPVLEMLGLAEQVAETDATVLILGETGTGKELLANEVHRLSQRKDRPMIKVNCAALPATLIESELFGREKGAYTGAMSRQIGRFEIADGSTLFLDEIGDLPPELQTKLLRVLQEGQFERLGSPKTINVDVRIIASTNRDLAAAVSSGSFREDLYYRLNVFSVTVPPLRDRVEDIPMLIWAFVKDFEGSMGKSIEKIPQKCIDTLKHYPWPGNIRELRNLVESAMIISKERTLRIHLPSGHPQGAQNILKLKDVERSHIMEVLKKTSWRVSGEKGAAKLLGVKPTTLASRMKKLGIVRPS